MRVPGVAAAALVLAAATGGIAAAATPTSSAAMGPSSADCAKGWNTSSRAGERREVSAVHLVRASILVSNSAACEIQFLAPGKRVFVARGTWDGHAATGWRLSVRSPSYVSPNNGVVLLAGGKIRTIGEWANIRYKIGPAVKQISGTVTSSG